jgi:hypothetical protein
MTQLQELEVLALSYATCNNNCPVVIAYDIYFELAEGKLDETWKLVDKKGKPNPVIIHVFPETLARQMLA